MKVIPREVRDKHYKNNISRRTLYNEWGEIDSLSLSFGLLAGSDYRIIRANLWRIREKSLSRIIIVVVTCGLSDDPPGTEMDLIVIPVISRPAGFRKSHLAFGHF